MDGDIGPLPALVEIAERHGAIMMIDDAHSSGVLGRNGRGTVDHFGLHGRVDVQVGTLSKAIGVLGGYVCGSRDLIEFLYHRARPFLFSTSHPPAVAAACLAAFDILESEPERIDKLWENTRYFKSNLKNAGFDTGESETPITPIIVGEAKTAHAYSAALFENGLLATGIGFPTVPEGRARVRTIVTATTHEGYAGPGIRNLDYRRQENGHPGMTTAETSGRPADIAGRRLRFRSRTDLAIHRIGDPRNDAAGD